MRETIFKYPLAHKPVQHIEMPSLAKILCVKTQNRQPFVWAIINPDTSSTELKTLHIHATGDEILNGIDLKYIGTYILDDPHHPTGTFVGHVFEEVKR